MKLGTGVLSNPYTDVITFEDYFLQIFEATYCHHVLVEYYVPSSSNLKGFAEKFFGLPDESIHPTHMPNIADLIGFENNTELLESAKENFRKTAIWQDCASLYQYAVNGIDPDFGEYKTTQDTWYSLVEEVNIYFQMINSDFSQLSDSVTVIISLALLRYGIDGEQEISFFHCDHDPIQVIALMAGLDERTVKNAQVQGAFRGDTYDLDFDAIKLWLSSKKGFTKSQIRSSHSLSDLSLVNTKQEFGLFMKRKREELGALFDLKVFPTKHYSFDKKTVEQIEQGVFSLPLDSISPLAKEYGLNYKDLLICIIRVFLPEEYRIMQEHTRE